jgi:hypothetical protein
MKQLILFSLMLMAGNALAQKPDVLQWISGTWVIKTNRGDLVEKWWPMNDSTLRGTSVMVKASGDTVLQETLELQWRNNTWLYVPTVQGQNDSKPVVFTIIFLGRDEFIAQNLAHDFPQRIAYRRIKNQLFASIEGNNNGKYSKRNFDFTLADSQITDNKPKE